MSNLTIYNKSGPPSVQRAVAQQTRNMEYAARLGAAAIDGLSGLHVYATERVMQTAATVGHHRQAAERTGVVSQPTIQAMEELDRGYCQDVGRVLEVTGAELARRVASGVRADPPPPTIRDRLGGG